MSVRAYLLLDIEGNKVEQAINSLRMNSGVLRIDILEGSPNVIVIIEASGQKRLTELTLRAFASIKELAGKVRLLHVKEKYSASPDADYSRSYEAENSEKAV